MDLICKWCGEAKPEVDFLRRDSSKPYSQSNVRCCKECNAARNRQRYKDPVIRDKQLAANDKWRKEHADRMEEYQRAFHERTPNRMKARNRIGYLVRSGQLQRQPCVICGSMEQVEGHHDSYAKKDWDTVRWLCKEHHEEWHQIIDPIKDPIIRGPLKEAEDLKRQAKDLLKQIHSLRIQYRHCVERAETLEIESWAAVLKKIDGLFEAKFGSTR